MATTCCSHHKRKPVTDEENQREQGIIDEYMSDASLSFVPLHKEWPKGTIPTPACVMGGVEAMLNNPMIQSRRVGGWGKVMAEANEFIGVNMMKSAGFNCFHTEDPNCPVVAFNNSTGWDTILVTQQQRHIRIQNKLRERKSKTPFSSQIKIDTTRRSNGSNATHTTGTNHVPYGKDECEAFLVSIVPCDGPKAQYRIETRRNPSKWSYALVPSHAIVDPQQPTRLLLAIPRTILAQYALPTQTKATFQQRVSEILMEIRSYESDVAALSLEAQSRAMKRPRFVPQTSQTVWPKRPKIA